MGFGFLVLQDKARLDRRGVGFRAFGVLRLFIRASGLEGLKGSQGLRVLRVLGFLLEGSWVVIRGVIL